MRKGNKRVLWEYILVFYIDFTLICSGFQHVSVIRF